MNRATSSGALCLGLLLVFLGAALAQDGQTRTSKTDEELRGWLENMAWYHDYSMEEMQQVTGLSAAALDRKLDEFEISPSTKPTPPSDRLFVLPYPGGRHPRIGFLDGAINPQRETKLSVFCPWDDSSYAVLDLPEAVWSNLGLTYLAHTHIDTVWTQQGITLNPQEWQVNSDGSFENLRRLPNGIEIGVKVIPLRDHLRMKMWLTNGTEAPLSDLRVQNCVMLKGVRGFDQQIATNKLFKNGYAVAGSEDQSRWIISGWDPVHRAWGNPPCPCLHSDPKFPDCPPGETQWLRGWFSFYEGEDIDAELERIEATKWRSHPLHHVTGNLVGKVIDQESKQTLPCRLYVQSLADNQYYFARSTAVAGSALVYDRQLGQTASIERHTTLSADGFQLDVPPGKYRVTAQHGKEYIPDSTIVEVGAERANITLRLKRFSRISDQGWYSGDTHVHRPAIDMPNVMLAEDVNVALPLGYWVRDSREIPAASGPPREAKPVYIDAKHVYYPINTEYEIFTVDGRRHTQGAVFILNHQEPLELTAPPVRKIASEARKQGGLLDLDKHSWNWSPMIVPLMEVDLFELSNNHHWQTQFGFPKWTLENAPSNWPEIEIDEAGFTEQGWTNFGLETYYAFVNCGFRMRVTAGTATGVHPVALGHGRVYVHCGDNFDYESWMDHLNRGHSFVTQGPLMDVRFNGELPGTAWSELPVDGVLRVSGTIRSQRPLTRIEVVQNGVTSAIDGSSTQQSDSTYTTSVDAEFPVVTTSWFALRCYEQADDRGPAGKVVFAHTNPVYIDVAGTPLLPRRRDVQYFIDRIEAEEKRNEGVISAEAMSEYSEAKSIYENLLESAQ